MTGKRRRQQRKRARAAAHLEATTIVVTRTAIGADGIWHSWRERVARPTWVTGVDPAVPGTDEIVLQFVSETGEVFRMRGIDARRFTSP